MRNSTIVKEFILLGFTDNHQLEIFLFFLLFAAYFLTIIGNIVILGITLVNPALHTPMYFFLQHVAIMEIGYTSATIPKTLANMATGRKTISLSGCFIQLLLYLDLGVTGFLLLAVMSIDRYVAICNPLRYSTIMNSQVCSVMVACSWVGGLLLILGPVIGLFQMPFCGPNTINHFFCDNGPLIKLACVDTSTLELMDFFVAILSLLGTLAINVVSYINIMSTILHIPLVTGRQKAFSTCASHLIVVSVTYGSCIFTYVKLKGTDVPVFSKVVTVLNTIVSPLLVPFVYCLRNKQVRDALKVVMGQCVVFCKNLR